MFTSKKQRPCLKASLTKKTLVSSAFSSAAQLLSKLLGLLSTLVVARVLAPEVFALAALLSITLYFVDVLGDVASETYILQKKYVSFFDIHSAWTLNILIKSCCCVFLLVIAPFAANFFEQPLLTLPLQTIATVLPIKSFCSAYFLKLKRHLKYGLLTLATFVERIFATTVLIVSALVLENVWSFVLADICGALVLVITSYSLTKSRPIFSLKNAGAQWIFSKWFLGKQIAGYLRSQLDTLFVAKFFSANITGHYYVARDVAMLPGRFLLGPAIEPLINSFRGENSPREAMLEKVALSYCVALIIATPITVFVNYFADIVTISLLGNQWSIASQYLRILIFLFFYWVILQITEQGLLARGKVRFLFFFDIFSLLFIAIALSLAVTKSQDITTLIETRVVAGFILTGGAVSILHVKCFNALKGVFINFLAFAVIAIISAELAGVVGGLVENLWLPAQLVIITVAFGSLYIPLVVLYVVKLSPKAYRGALSFIFQEALTTLSAFRR